MEILFTCECCYRSLSLKKNKKTNQNTRDTLGSLCIEAVLRKFKKKYDQKVNICNSFIHLF